LAAAGDRHLFYLDPIPYSTGCRRKIIPQTPHSCQEQISKKFF